MDSNTKDVLTLALLTAGPIFTAWISLKIKSKVDTIELNTNSMKDALVKAEKSVSFDQGVKAEASRQNYPSNPPPVQPSSSTS